MNHTWTWLLTMSVVRNTAWVEIATSSAAHATATMAHEISEAVVHAVGWFDTRVPPVAPCRCWLLSRSGPSVGRSKVAPGRARLRGAATGYGAAGIVMAVGALRPAPSAWQLTMAALATVVAAAVAVATSAERGRGWVVAGPLIGAAAAVLYAVTPPGLATMILALLAGAAVGLAAPRPWRPARVDRRWRCGRDRLGRSSCERRRPRRQRSRSRPWRSASRPRRSSLHRCPTARPADVDGSAGSSRSLPCSPRRSWSRGRARTTRTCRGSAP